MQRVSVRGKAASLLCSVGRAEIDGRGAFSFEV